MKKILLFGLVFALFTTAASAQLRSDAVKRHRIESGFQSGQLTRGERLNLHKDRIRYQNAKRKALRDGRLTPRERRMLKALKRHDSRKIYTMKHNNRRRIF